MNALDEMFGRMAKLKINSKHMKFCILNFCLRTIYNNFLGKVVDFEMNKIHNCNKRYEYVWVTVWTRLRDLCNGSMWNRRLNLVALI